MPPMISPISTSGEVRLKRPLRSKPAGASSASSLLKAANRTSAASAAEPIA